MTENLDLFSRLQKLNRGVDQTRTLSNDVVIRASPSAATSSGANHMAVGAAGAGAKSAGPVGLLQQDIAFFYSPKDIPFAAVQAYHAATSKVKGQFKLLNSQQYEIPEVKLMKTGEVLRGINSITRFYARIADQYAGTALYGNDALTASLVDFFLDFAQNELVGRFDDGLEAALAQLDQHLATRTFFVGSAFTIADYAVWGGLKGNKRWAPFARKFAHLNRWFEACEKDASFQQTITKVAPVAAKVAPAAKAETKQAADSKAPAAIKPQEQGGSFDIDLPDAKMGAVCTRFPPEPSGYLHIGHAKAAMLNDTIAKLWGGKMLLRFDDTNPSKEKDEFVVNIKQDLQTLGVTFAQTSYTSDHFDTIWEYGTKMLKEGKAFIDDTPAEEMKVERGAKQNSRHRDRPIEENLKLWEEMKKGSEIGVRCAMRAKIDMQSDNGTMRDPVMFRCNLTPHHRTGTKYKCYPTYDFACPIVDSIEGVSHALRTTEYHDRNEQYYWIINALGIRKVHIWDFSRLGFKYTLMSKRKLQYFVDNKLVDGWYDPRFPTVQGIMRRGLTIEALREFIRIQGASKAVALMEWDKLWVINKSVLDPIAHRYFAVSKEDVVTFNIVNAPKQGIIEEKEVPLLIKNPAAGSRRLPFTSSVYIEQFDAQELKEGQEVVLLNWSVMVIAKIHSKDVNGKRIVTTVDANVNPAGDFKKKTYLHWVPKLADDKLVHVNMVEYGDLITKEKIEEEDDFIAFINPNSKAETAMIGEPALANVKPNDKIQLQRRGFFRCDKFGTTPKEPLVLFSIPDGSESNALGSKLEKKTRDLDRDALRDQKKNKTSAKPAAPAPAPKK